MKRGRFSLPGKISALFGLLLVLMAALAAAATLLPLDPWLTFLLVLLAGLPLGLWLIRPQ